LSFRILVRTVVISPTDLTHAVHAYINDTAGLQKHLRSLDLLFALVDFDDPYPHGQTMLESRINRFQCAVIAPLAACDGVVNLGITTVEGES
jgi:hypothetical protein